MSQTSPECRSLPEPPTDGITSLSYIPSVSTSLLASTSWDGNLRIHDTSTMSNQCSQAMESGPLLSLIASPGGDGGSSLFTGGLDGSIKRFDVATSTVSVVGHHSPETINDHEKVACSCLSPVSFSSSESSSLNTPVLASAGWDSFFYLWDIRAGNASSQNKPMARVKLPDKAFSMDVDPSSGCRLVISTAKRRTCIIDVRKASSVVVADNDSQEYMAEMVLERESSLKYQTRVSRFFPNGSGIAVGSIEGRVAIEFLDELNVSSNGKKKYAFKCHRVGDIVYPVNAIAFHPKYGTFATGGCDGTVVTWDGLNKKKIYTLPKFPTSIAALAFNHDGSELAIASSYTFEEGEKDHPRDEIYIRSMLDSECKPKGMK